MPRSIFDENNETKSAIKMWFGIIVFIAVCTLLYLLQKGEVMPKFRIYVPVIADDVYEVEAASKEDARQMYEDGLDYEHFIHTTDPSDMVNVEIDIEEVDD